MVLGALRQHYSTAGKEWKDKHLELYISNISIDYGVDAVDVYEEGGGGIRW